MKDSEDSRSDCTAFVVGKSRSARETNIVVGATLWPARHRHILEGTRLTVVWDRARRGLRGRRPALFAFAFCEPGGLPALCLTARRRAFWSTPPFNAGQMTACSSSTTNPANAAMHSLLYSQSFGPQATGEYSLVQIPSAVSGQSSSDSAGLLEGVWTDGGGGTGGEGLGSRRNNSRPRSWCARASELWQLEACWPTSTATNRARNIMVQSKCVSTVTWNEMRIKEMPIVRRLL
jgi:hypothetical protein